MIYKGYLYYIQLNNSDKDSLSGFGKPGDTAATTEEGGISLGKPTEEENTTEDKNTIEDEKDSEHGKKEKDTTEEVATGEDANQTSEDFVLTTETAEPTKDDSSGEKTNLTMIFGITSAVLLLIVIYLATKLSRLKNGNSYNDDSMDYSPDNDYGTPDMTGNMEYTAGSNVSHLSKSTEERVGKLHNIGRRKGQQDSLGLTEYNGGTLAVVADGMGGLADGDRVSQKIVMTLLQDSTKLSGGSPDNKLYEMVAHANREVNKMLGPEGLYKSGSTLLAVMAEKDGFHWAAVGDSHIYLFRAGKLLLMNREHVYEAELIQKAINGENSFAEVKTNPKKGGLTSFIGMGNLKYIDGSIDKVTSGEGDWILLMSDGVFNTVPEPDMCRLLNEAPSAKVAAERLEQEVLRRQNPKQDNFTAIILEL